MIAVLEDLWCNALVIYVGLCNIYFVLYIGADVLLIIGADVMLFVFYI